MSNYKLLFELLTRWVNFYFFTFELLNWTWKYKTTLWVTDDSQNEKPKSWYRTTVIHIRHCIAFEILLYQKKKKKKKKIEAKFELENSFVGLFDLKFTRVSVLCENETTFYIDICILMWILIELVIRFQIQEKWILFSVFFSAFPFFLPCNKYTVGYLVKYLLENLVVWWNEQLRRIFPVNISIPNQHCFDVVDQR